MINRLLFITILISFNCLPVCSQQSRIDSLFGKLDPQRWAASIEKKAARLQDKIIAKSQKTLSKLQKQEEKIYRRMLGTKDSLQAKAALGNIKSKYQSLQDKIKNPAIGNGAKQYISKLDTLNTALKFLDQNGMGGKVKDALAKTESLQNKFQQAEEIKRIIRDRRQQLKAQLESLGMVKELKKFNREIFYYGAQIKEYREVLKDSRKAERKALELLSKTRLFREFMQKNSLLASLFRPPGGDPSSIGVTGGGLAGLQTRVQVNTLIQQQLGSGGPNAQQQFQQNMNSAQNQINQLKDRISQSGGGSSEDIMPEGFKANPEKTKSFLKRLEYSVNTQSQKATNFFPVTTDLGLSLGYKVSDKSIIGIGASYKLGWGRGWNHINLTSEGIGLRSFIDWKAPFGSPKGGMGRGLWITGGYEMNYNTSFRDFDQLRNYPAWSRSGLVGISKVVSFHSPKGGAGGGFFKKTKLQLLWDFLSYRQVPRTQPVVFRIGYVLR